jgi:hypothetical protein
MGRVPEYNSQYPSRLTGTSAPSEMRKRLKLSSEGGVVVTNANEAIVAPMVGSGGDCVWRECGVRLSVLCWCVLQESGFSRHGDVSLCLFLLGLLTTLSIPCIIYHRMR